MKKVIAELKKEIKELRSELNFYREKCQRIERAYNQLIFHFKQFQRHRFGCKSERFKDGDLLQQGDLFGDFITDEFGQEDDEDEDAKVISIAAHKRCKKKVNKFPADLPRREEIIKAKDRTCICGKEKVLMRYETTELLNHIPEVFEVIEQKREVLVCPDGCSGSIVIAENPPKVLPKIKVTESVLSHIIVSKLHDRQPLYHLEKKFSDRFGIDISRNNLARWFIETAQALQPLINLMKDEVIDYDVSSCDATSIQVLAEPGRAATKKSYWYCIRGGHPDKKCILYDYNATEHKLFLVNWFEGFKGYIHVDAQNIFDELANQEGIELVYCNAHARRKFEPIAKAVKADGLAKAAMKIYQELYKIERHIKNLNPSQCFIYRINTAKPILDEYKVWLDKNYQTVLPKSPLGEAFAYSIRHWSGLTRYLYDGRLEFDNNGTEREIKPAVISRKNFLFAYSVAGVKALCTHMSLIRSALLHGFDPYHYYVAILKTIPYCQTVEDYEKLLPWNIELKKVRETKVSAVA